VAARLNHLANDPDAESDADYAVYRKLKAAFEVPTADKADRRILVAGDIAPNDAADQVLASLLNP
jgi:hypothetical protein